MPPDEIISNHTVHSQTECSLMCLQKSTCVGFNYRIKSNKYVVNCQLSNKTYERENGENKETGEWMFYQDVRTTVSERTILTILSLTLILLITEVEPFLMKYL